MIRMLLLLCAGLFVTLQVAGEDRGQMRFGLMEAKKEAELLAQAPVAVPQLQDAPAVDEPVARAAEVAPVLPQNDPRVVPVVFSTQQVMTASAAPQAPERASETLGDVKYVVGRSVNVRSGPSTRNGVVGKLTRGEAVTVVWVEQNGWARVRVEGDGIDGYMSADFLTDKAP